MMHDMTALRQLADDRAEAAACRALWAEVAALAIADARKGQQADMQYLLSPDFALVLELSGMDTGQATRAAHRANHDVVEATAGGPTKPAPSRLRSNAGRRCVAG